MRRDRQHHKVPPDSARRPERSLVSNVVIPTLLQENIRNRLHCQIFYMDLWPQESHMKEAQVIYNVKCHTPIHKYPQNASCHDETGALFSSYCSQIQINKSLWLREHLGCDVRGVQPPKALVAADTSDKAWKQHAPVAQHPGMGELGYKAWSAHSSTEKVSAVSLRKDNESRERPSTGVWQGPCRLESQCEFSSLIFGRIL